MSLDDASCKHILHYRVVSDYTFIFFKPHSHFTCEAFLDLTPFVTSQSSSSLSFVLIAGSSSFESQKMERPSLNVLSPSSPGMLQDAPQLMPGQLSVSVPTP